MNTTTEPTRREIAEAHRINRELDRLTRTTRLAYGSYSRTKERRQGRIQSGPETAAYRRYQDKEAVLTAFCDLFGITVPKTWS